MYLHIDIGRGDPQLSRAPVNPVKSLSIIVDSVCELSDATG